MYCVFLVLYPFRAEPFWCDTQRLVWWKPLATPSPRPSEYEIYVFIFVVVVAHTLVCSGLHVFLFLSRVRLRLALHIVAKITLLYLQCLSLSRSFVTTAVAEL